MANASILGDLPAGRALPTRYNLLRRLFARGGIRFGMTVIAIVVVAAIFGPLFTTAGVENVNLTQKLVPPVWLANGTWSHPLGTDHLGRDTLATMMIGARYSLAIGLVASVLAMTIGVVLGVSGAYWGGNVDLLVNFILTVRLTLPVVLVALVAVALLGNSLVLLVLIIGGLLWDRVAIVIRSATQQILRNDFVTAARAIGSSTPRILMVEILPNLRGPLVVLATVELANAILLEATLSFLGLGVQPPLISWGVMIANAKAQLLFRPWLFAIPGFTLMTLIVAVNLVGDGLVRAMSSGRDDTGG